MEIETVSKKKCSIRYGELCRKAVIRLATKIDAHKKCSNHNFGTRSTGERNVAVLTMLFVQVEIC